MKNGDKMGVNRRDQLKKVRDIIEQFRDEFRSRETRVINWYGVPGIGKTCLGMMIGYFCGNEWEVPFARIDFDPEQNPDVGQYVDKPFTMVRQIYHQLSRYRGLDIPESRDVFSDEDRLDGFFNVIETVLETTPLVILFDTTEKMDWDVSCWLESSLLEPLCFMGRTLIIWTGRYEEVFRNFQVRKRTFHEKLVGLDETYTKKQVGTSGTWIYRFTYGYPLANERIARALGELETEPDDPEPLKDLIHEMLYDYLLREIPGHIKFACKTLSVLRQFDLYFLEEILSGLDPQGWFEGCSDFTSVINELRETSLVVWDTELKGYAIDSALRRFFVRYLQLAEPQTFEAITTRALKLYDSYIGANIENRTLYFKEKLYHLIQIHKSRKLPESEILNQYRMAMDDYIQMIQFDSTIMTQLKEEIKSDSELNEIAGNNLIKDILRRLHSEDVTDKHTGTVGERGEDNIL